MKHAVTLALLALLTACGADGEPIPPTMDKTTLIF